jgi:hypothetical protein
LARAGQSAADDILRAYAAAAEALSWGLDPKTLPADANVDMARLDSALRTLEGASRPLKKQFLLACTTCVAVDGHVSVEEGELLRAISDSLGCPMPPWTDSVETSAAT